MGVKSAFVIDIYIIFQLLLLKLSIYLYMELRQLKYFVTVSKTLSFSEAAKRLFITQGTLSQQIKQLEDELGFQLFSRTSHSVALTEAGEELLPVAKRTLEESDNCRRKMNDLRGALTGTLCIGVTHSFSMLLGGTIRDFMKTHPGVKLKVYYKTATELLDMLVDGDLDLFLAFRPAQLSEDIEAETLFSSRLSVVMRKGHPLAGKKEISVEDLKSQGIALPGSGLQARKNFERFVNLDTRDLDVRVELNDPMIILDILQSSDMVSILSSFAIYYRPDLVAIPMEGVTRVMEGCVHQLKAGYRKKAASVFIDMLRDSALIERANMRVSGK